MNNPEFLAREIINLIIISNDLIKGIVLYFKRSLLALAICASVVSVEAVANTRANDMASSATPASVGHRPVATTNAKNRSVWGTDDRFNPPDSGCFY